MIIYIDIDNTITITNATDYSNAIPLMDRISTINQLHSQGHTIVYWTARGSGSKIDYSELTKKQLKDWGCLYSSIKFEKPIYDLFIDDKAINSESFIDHINNYY